MPDPRAFGDRRSSYEKRAQRLARSGRIPIAKARANVARSASLRAYWTRVKSYQAKHPRLSVREAARSKAFRNTERLIKKSERGVREGATEKQQRAAAEKLMRALQRQGLNIGKGKTWRDYIRKRGRR